MAVNCWDYMNCGREPGGPNVASLGVCPAAEPSHLDGMNGGVNGGRACWWVAGTLCEGTVAGSYADKFDDCQQCDFYIEVTGE